MFESTVVCGRIALGIQGEHNARKVSFYDAKIWQEKLGQGRFELLHQRNGDDIPYPIVLNVEDGVPYWYVTSSDTAIVGEGKCELRYMVNDVLIKSCTYITDVTPSLGENTAEVPAPEKAWVDQVLEAGETARQAVESSEKAIEAAESAEQFAKDAEAFASEGNGHIADESNPHNVTASQVGAYTKAEVGKVIDNMATAMEEVLSGKADKNKVYTKAETDEKLKNPSYEEQVKLTGITTAVPGWDDAGIYISDNSIGSASAEFTIDVQGDVKFNTSCVGEPEHTADFYIDGEMVARCGDGESFTFEGHVSQNIRVHCSFLDVYFIEFTKKVYVKDAVGDINGKIGDIDLALDAILAIQSEVVGDEA